MEYMTIKEIAESLNVSERVVQITCKKLVPNIVKNGITTFLDEGQVTAIKLELESHHNLEGTFEVSTELEMYLLDKKVQQWKDNKILELTEKNKLLEHKNSILMHVSKVYTATEIAKELDMRSAQELNQKLEDMGIQYKVNETWVLTAEYAGSGYFDIKQNVLDSGKVVYDRKITQLGRDFIVNLFTIKEDN